MLLLLLMWMMRQVADCQNLPQQHYSNLLFSDFHHFSSYHSVVAKMFHLYRCTKHDNNKAKSNSHKQNYEGDDVQKKQTNQKKYIRLTKISKNSSIVERNND